MTDCSLISTHSIEIICIGNDQLKIHKGYQHPPTSMWIEECFCLGTDSGGFKGGASQNAPPGGN